VRERKEVEEVKKVKEIKEGVAAFFDLDGTLTALPSLERRFFRMLRYQQAISVKNYFSWLKEALRLMPRGINAILQANKMYLRGVRNFDESGEGDGNFSSSHKSGRPAESPSKLGVNGASQAQGQASSPPRRNAGLPVPGFFPQAIERVAWHATQRHAIVLMSGTLERLARGAARDLEAALAARGIAMTIHVCATRLEERDGNYTGRVLGEAMFGEAKARAVKRLAEEMQFNLRRCYAYGDSTQDRWLLEAVGKPTAVNPSNDLADIARMHQWPVLLWNEGKELTQRTQSSQRAQRRERKNNDRPVEKSVLRRVERCA
jgi:HAD superfamily phosphoserine phosphatase-like hydrolase